MTRNMISLVIVTGFVGTASAQVLVEEDFESGTLDSFSQFPTLESNFGISGDANNGSFAGEFFNINTATGPSGAVVQLANLGVGVVESGDEIEISFAAKGDFLVGGVGIAEFFSEVDGGGTSASEILSGGPLFVANEAEYQQFTFVTFAGPDVSGGVTLQFVAATGAATGSLSRLLVDDISVRIIPAPTTAGLLALGGLAGVRRRR